MKSIISTLVELHGEPTAVPRRHGGGGKAGADALGRVTRKASTASRFPVRRDQACLLS